MLSIQDVDNILKNSDIHPYDCIDIKNMLKNLDKENKNLKRE